MGIEPFLIGASVVGVIAQRLIRRLCPRCKEMVEATERDKKIVGVTKDVNIYRSTGCHICNGTGYSGRIGVYEIMPITEKIREVINNNGTADDIRRVAIQEGLKTLRSNAARLVLDGTTTVDEMIRISYAND